MKLPHVLAVSLLILATGGCNNQQETPSASIKPFGPAMPPMPTTVVTKKETKAVTVPKIVKTPEVECDELISKLKDVGYWSSSGLSETGEQRLIQDVYVGDHGVLQMGMCDWFWKLETDQMRERLENIQHIWASVHSPSAPNKSSLSCWIPDMKNVNGIPIKVNYKGVTTATAQKLWNETRGTVSAKTLKRYLNEQWDELHDRPKR